MKNHLFPNCEQTQFQIIQHNKPAEITLGFIMEGTRYNSLVEDTWYFVAEVFDIDSIRVNNSLEGVFCKVKRISKTACKIIEQLADEDLLSALIRLNTFTELSANLNNLGLSQKLIDNIPAGHSYVDFMEICSCGDTSCQSRKVFIIRNQSSFSIPFIYRYASPNHWLEFPVKDLEPLNDGIGLLENYGIQPGEIIDESDKDLDVALPVCDANKKLIGYRDKKYLDCFPLKQPGFEIDRALLKVSSFFKYTA